VIVIFSNGRPMMLYSLDKLTYITAHSINIIGTTAISHIIPAWRAGSVRSKDLGLW
jgi:hypothetical protein